MYHITVWTLDDGESSDEIESTYGEVIDTTQGQPVPR